MFFDIHTHSQKQEKEVFSIVNFSLSETENLNPSVNYSLGLHPWKIQEETLSENLSFIAENAQLDCIKLIGETGLDKICDTPWNLQEKAFVDQIQISEKINKPLIIHCVKAFDELIAIKKELKPQQVWIIHGFRGKFQQMEQLIQQGFYLSFGIHFNKDSVRFVPKDRLFLETDNNNVPIQEIYRKMAEATELKETELLVQIEKNFRRIFGTLFVVNKRR
jgi:TatD DNase family protein